MKKVLALSGALLLVACSSMPPARNAVNEREYVCDRAYMSRIEQKAQETGVYVQWLNCPLIRREQAKTVS